MKFLAITLIVHSPDPITGIQKSTNDRFREVIDNALLAEDLGLLGFGEGERHERSFFSSSPPVVPGPEQVIDRVNRYHEQFVHRVLHLHADSGGLTDAQHRQSLEPFQSDIAPLSRGDIPDPPWEWVLALADPVPVYV